MGSRLRAVALLVIVLLAGSAIGWYVADNTHDKRRAARKGTEKLLKRMTQRYDLSSAQQDSIRVILNRRRADIDSLWADVNPRFESIRSATNAQIEAQLKPEQVVTFRERLKAREEKRREREKARGPR
jgi:small-conductance mechanosensitive channel